MVEGGVRAMQKRRLAAHDGRQRNAPSKGEENQF
jgi:hypothetical protein